jgi:peptidoglycan/xylan/chitin deacetylase (PgdA/CDA1 family)
MLRLLAFSFFAASAFAAPDQPATAPASPAATPTPAAVTVPAASTPASVAAPATGTAEAATPPSATPSAPAPALTAVAAAKQITFSQCHVDGPYIAMTFDDGPNAATTPRLLKMLKERDIKATFFLVGQCVAAEPDVARMVVAAGHEIANHSWSHPQLTKMKEESVRDQLQRTNDVIKQETGITPTLMRPPYGAFTIAQRNWAHATWNYQCILWDVDSLDWKHHNPAKTQSIILSETRPGSIILCHDIHKTTVDAMPATLDALIAKGFKFVTVSELIKMDKGKPVKGTAKPAPAAKTLTAKEAAGAATSLDDLGDAPKIAVSAKKSTAKTPTSKAPVAKPVAKKK